MAHLIEGRHVNAADLRKLAEHLGTGHASVAQFAMALAELDDLFLALSSRWRWQNSTICSSPSPIIMQSKNGASGSGL